MCALASSPLHSDLQLFHARDVVVDLHSMLSKASALSHGAILLSTTIISVTYEPSSLLARPVQSSIVLLFILGLSFLFLCNFIAHFISSSSASSTNAFRLPLQEVPVSNGRKDSNETRPGHFDTSRPRSRRTIIVSTAVAISLRLLFSTLILDDVQCAMTTLEAYLPLLLAIYDYWYIQRMRPKSENPPRNNGATSRHLWPAICLAAAYSVKASAMHPPRSTYICPLSSSANIGVPFMQITSILLDCYVLVTISDIASTVKTDVCSKSDNASVVVGCIFLLSSVLLFLGGTIALVINRVYWVELFGVDWSYTGSLAWQAILATLTVVAALHVSTNHGLPHLAIFILCIFIYCTGLTFTWTNRNVLPPNGKMSLIAFLGLYLIGATLFVHTEAVTGSGRGQPPQRLSRRLQLSMASILILFVLFLGWSYDFQTQELVAHPIDWLISKAEKQSSDWENQASASQSLAESVQEYQRRYQQHPPPGFDAWYRYATARNSVIIDDYDTMMDDLLPFWGISPAEIRLRTQQVIADEWNEVSEVIIRNGHAELGPNFLPTHRWMLEGAMNLVKDFSTYLPDMVVAFNLNDEPRVAVPFKDMQRLRGAGAGYPKHLDKSVQHTWSADRAATWPVLEDPGPMRPFEDHSRTNAFSAGTVACPPSSFAQRATAWDGSTLCTSCAAPHSHGLFLSNWTLSASPCHQPDLRNLHGFYLSPAAFKPSHQLLPIFSQSKVAGYADILYPSPWNYMDKIAYNPTDEHPDPPFADKENTLFWRGATSEGVSRHGTWKGMTRQRLVHLANNLSTTPTSRSPTLPLLLLNKNDDNNGKYTYQTPNSNPIKVLNLSLDIAIVDGIARAWDNDGAAQTAEFGFAPPTDFQHHWRYRHLMDVDGAGFSGRFLPFLQSGSLPFRAGIFRCWWDGRLTPWKHFVPVDVRLHGLMATVAYFMGTGGGGAGEGGVGGRTVGQGGEDGMVMMKGNVAAGERIAEAGREWAGKVLRKEDMEIYMFRLLLEWGRLTDDKRDEIGFGG